MTTPTCNTHFSQHVLDDIFPAERADQFFEALFGDATEGAYDIALTYAGETQNQIAFEFKLTQRPGKCLACHLTYGLPEVFMRHPVIDVAGVIKRIDSILENGKRCGTWRLGRTIERSRDVHVLPLTVELKDGDVSAA